MRQPAGSLWDEEAAQALSQQLAKWLQAPSTGASPSVGNPQGAAWL